MEIILDIHNYFERHLLDDSLLLSMQFDRNLNQVEVIFEPSEYFWIKQDPKILLGEPKEVVKRYFRKFLFQGVSDFFIKNAVKEISNEVIYKATKEDESTFTIDTFKVLKLNTGFTIEMPISSFGVPVFNFECLWEERREADVIKGPTKNTWVYLDSKTKEEFDFYEPFGA